MKSITSILPLLRRRFGLWPGSLHDGRNQVTWRCGCTAVIGLCQDLGKLEQTLMNIWIDKYAFEDSKVEIWSIFRLWWTWASLSHCECTYILVLVVPSWGSLTWSWSWESHMRPHWRDHFFLFGSLPSWKLTYPFPKGDFLKMIFRPLPGYILKLWAEIGGFWGSTLRFNLLKMPGEDIFKGPSQHLPRILKAELSWFKNCRKVNAVWHEAFLGCLVLLISKKADRGLWIWGWHYCMLFKTFGACDRGGWE